MRSALLGLPARRRQLAHQGLIVSYRWLTISATQIALGLHLHHTGAPETAKLLWASALGQGVTANLKARR